MPTFAKLAASATRAFTSFQKRPRNVVIVESATTDGAINISWRNTAYAGQQGGSGTVTVYYRAASIGQPFGNWTGYGYLANGISTTQVATISGFGANTVFQIRLSYGVGTQDYSSTSNTITTRPLAPYFDSPTYGSTYGATGDLNQNTASTRVRGNFNSGSNTTYLLQNGIQIATFADAGNYTATTGISSTLWTYTAYTVNATSGITSRTVTKQQYLNGSAAGGSLFLAFSSWPNGNNANYLLYNTSVYQALYNQSYIVQLRGPAYLYCPDTGQPVYRGYLSQSSQFTGYASNLSFLVFMPVTQENAGYYGYVEVTSWFEDTLGNQITWSGVPTSQADYNNTNNPC